ncbi:hypothetical protein ACNYMP_00375 [Ligilactobacillus salivarius]|uniref:hypothetical protein n=1 Tax=Ligilactobacillus salivarius TaxID=1624 RepID=UPI0009D95C68|nr:hypothetical protein [Ligilactobacillus salivarius]OQR09842.1 hypothetical protein B6U45_05725 [Ligilactobacillus salivarius]PAY31943.1 hypothetical protein A8C35_02150 [Ligilactobacillus salivarius]
MTKDKTKQLNKSLINYIDALDAINKNYVTLHNLNKDIEELEKEIDQLEKLDVPTYQTSKLKDEYNVKASSFNSLLELNNSNLIVLWKLAKSLLKQFNQFTEDEIKQLGYIKEKEIIEKHYQKYKPKFIDLLKYDIKHIKD